MTLGVFFICFLCLGLRNWHLAVVKNEEAKQKAIAPVQKVVFEPAYRGTIRDRFNIPMAVNRISYQAAFLYSEIKTIPTVAYRPTGKIFPRKEYIQNLAETLADELHLEKERLVDLIHGKAALQPHLPLVIKEDLEEKEFYRLKAEEKKWPGLHLTVKGKRFYPFGNVGGSLLGYMGSVSKSEYEAAKKPLKILQEQLKEAYEEGSSEEEIAFLEEAIAKNARKIYHLSDQVGKAGIEARFEKELKGLSGRKVLHCDAKGIVLKEKGGSLSKHPGKRVVLTISCELQAFAEELLAASEDMRKAIPSKNKSGAPGFAEPWIKGGSIIAMNPLNGEILAMASYPRFDPNDFILTTSQETRVKKLEAIHRCLEDPVFLKRVYDGHTSLTRERWDLSTKKVVEEEVAFTWSFFLDRILPLSHPVRIAFHDIDVKTGYFLLKFFSEALSLAPNDSPDSVLNALFADDSHHVPFKTGKADLPEDALLKLSPFFQESLSSLKLAYDKLLFLDLLRLLIDVERFDESLTDLDLSLDDWKRAGSAYAVLSEVIQKYATDLFHDEVFTPWRRENEKAFLKEKREEELAQGKRHQSYLDLLDTQEKRLFQPFWKQERPFWMLSFLGRGQAREDSPFQKAFLEWHKELEAGAHQGLFWKKSFDALSSLIKKVPEGKEEAFLKALRSADDLSRPLWGTYPHLKKASMAKPIERDLAYSFHPKEGFGFGRSFAFRSHTTQGSLFKLVTAHTVLKKLSMQGLPLEPLEMTDWVFRTAGKPCVGYFADGKPISQIYRGGRLPRSASPCIGPIDLVRAIEYSSNPYFALLAGEYLDDPKELVEAAKDFSYGEKTGVELPGEARGILPGKMSRGELYAFAIGQGHFSVTPLQTAIMLSTFVNGGKVLSPKLVKSLAWEEEGGVFLKEMPHAIKNEVFMPKEIETPLLQGMRRVVAKLQKGETAHQLFQVCKKRPEAALALLELGDRIFGKTSTSEQEEVLGLGLEAKNIYTHLWFGGILWDKEKKKPELVVIVYLRFGSFGKEAAPLAALVMKKWLEIKARALHPIAA